jgi:hypothetical protein
MFHVTRKNISVIRLDKCAKMISLSAAALRNGNPSRVHRLVPHIAMAWRSSSNGYGGLIDNLQGHGIITSPSVKEAMMKVDRKHFCPTDPYLDKPRPIGSGATISAPHMHATALEYLLKNIEVQK